MPKLLGTNSRRRTWERQVSKWRWRRGCWIVVAVGLDVAAWSALGHVYFLAENPGSASALALCWIHAFVLPALLGCPWRGLLRLVAATSIGMVAAPFALLAGFIAGLQVWSVTFLIGFAISGPYNADAVYDPPGALLRTVKGVLVDIVLWSGPAAGSAIALIAAVGLAAILPDAQRPRLSWWLVAAGAWALIVFLPDWLIRSLQIPWREPILLAAAGLPSILLLLNHRAITPSDAG